MMLSIVRNCSEFQDTSQKVYIKKSVINAPVYTKASVIGPCALFLVSSIHFQLTFLSIE